MRKKIFCDTSTLRSSTVLASIFLVSIVLIVFWKTISHDFIEYDDNVYVYKNSNVSEGLSLKSIIWAFTDVNTGNWHPMTWLSHMLDSQLFGLNPAGHHFTNLLLHTMNTILLFFVFNVMAKDFWRSLFVAALFAVHPLHVESVAWIAERKDLLSSFFCMLTLWVYVKYVQKPKLLNYLLLGLSFALGLMAKPMLVTVPFLLLLLDFWPLCRFEFFDLSKDEKFRNTWNLILEKIPLFVLSGIISIITYFAQKNAGAISSPEWGDRVSNILTGYTAYIYKMFWPKNLAILYPLSDVQIWKTVSSGILLTIIFIIAFKNARRFPYLLMGWLWYTGTLVPVIGLVKVGTHSIADKYTYLPYIGLFVALSWFISDLLAKWRYKRTFFIITGSAVLIVLISVARNQVSYWRNSVTLFEHTLKITPGNYFVHNFLGGVYLSKGQLKKAEKEIKKALKINPYFAEAHYNLGGYYYLSDLLEDAEREFKATLALKPDLIMAKQYLQNIYKEKGEMDKANP